MGINRDAIPLPAQMQLLNLCSTTVLRPLAGTIGCRFSNAPLRVSSQRFQLHSPVGEYEPALCSRGRQNLQLQGALAQTLKLLRWEGKASMGQMKGQEQRVSLPHRNNLGRHWSFHMCPWMTHLLWQTANQGSEPEIIISKVIYDSFSCFSLSTTVFCATNRQINWHQLLNILALMAGLLSLLAAPLL